MYEAMAALNALVALAYFTIAFFIAPKFGLPFVARFFGVMFFIACGGTHLELMIHTLSPSLRSDWLVEGHMFVIHGFQAFVDWGFIIASVYLVDIDVRPKEGKLLGRRGRIDRRLEQTTGR